MTKENYEKFQEHSWYELNAFFRVVGDLLDWNLPDAKKIEDIKYIYDKHSKKIEELRKELESKEDAK